MRSAVIASADSRPRSRNGRSTTTFQYPNASLGKTLDCADSSIVRKAAVTRSMSSGPNSQFLLPRFLRRGFDHAVASISCTFPLRSCAFLLASTHTYVAMPVL